MASSTARRGLLLGILIMIMPAAGNAAAGDAPYRRWGLGWGDWMATSGIGHNAVGLRYRTPRGWNVTVAGYFSTSEREGGGGSIYYPSGDTEIDTRKPLERGFTVELARSFPLHPRVQLGPAIRFVHHYAREEHYNESLWIAGNAIDWHLRSNLTRTRDEDYCIGLGFRPQVLLHPRVSVEAGLFLDYWRSHDRDWGWSRDEWDEGTVEVNESTYTISRKGLDWTYPTPSANMSVILFFYF